MSCYESLGNLFNEPLDNEDDILNQFGYQPEEQTAQFGTSPEYDLLTHLQPPHQGGTSQFATTPNHAELNPGSMNAQYLQWAQQPGTSQFATTPNHAELNPGSMNVQYLQWAQQQGASQSPNITNAADAANEEKIKASKRKSRKKKESPNITNAADAAKEEKIKESKRKSYNKKETQRKDNEKMLAEVTKVNGDLLKDNERLEKEVGEAKVNLKSVEQELRYREEQVGGFNKQLREQTKLVDVLSKRLVASPEATSVAEENKQLKRKIELLTTAANNPDIIKTVELQEENEKLKRELKKLRFINEALCDTLNKDEQ